MHIQREAQMERGKKRPTIEAKRNLLYKQKETYYIGKKRPTIQAKRDLLYSHREKQTRAHMHIQGECGG